MLKTCSQIAFCCTTRGDTAKPERQRTHEFLNIEQTKMLGNVTRKAAMGTGATIIIQV
jgi:hypothetical protein